MTAQTPYRKAKCVRCRRIRHMIGTMCDDCRGHCRESNRARYRRKHGIPLDSPLLTRGRLTIKDEITNAH